MADGQPGATRVVVEHDGHVAHVLLNRPDKRNAIDGRMFTELRDTALELAVMPSVRAVVLSGAGHCFSSGLDMASFAAMASGEVTGDAVSGTNRDLSPSGATPPQQIGWAWYELPVPVIAAVEGYALGAGLHIALGADLRIVAPDATLGFVEIDWGLAPDLSGTQSLRRLVPLDVAKRIVFTGERLSGAEAVARGLATMVDDDPVTRALELARDIAGRSPDAIRAAKRILNRSGVVGVAEGLADEVATAAALVGSTNQIEAVMARLESRAPVFDDPAPSVTP